MADVLENISEIFTAFLLIFIANNKCSLSDYLHIKVSYFILRKPVRSGHPVRSEEHTSELQSRQYLVCRLLLEKKNNNNNNIFY